MAGTAVCKSLSQHDLIAPPRYGFNIGNCDQVLKYAKEKIDFIIHLAAETDHEYCEYNPSHCYFINTIGTANLVELAKKLNVPIIYLSAGSIFDGTIENPYYTDSQPNPVNHYNKSKYLGELVVKSYRKHYIVRAGWMFGGGPNVDKKFVNKIMQKIIRGDREIKVCDDCIGSPTYTLDLADSIKSLIDNPFYGIYHCSNSNTGISRYDFAKLIINTLNLQRRVKIVPCKIDDLKEEFPCKRTNYEVIHSSFECKPLKQALKEYLYAHYRH